MLRINKIKISVFSVSVFKLVLQHPRIKSTLDCKSNGTVGTLSESNPNYIRM